MVHLQMQKASEDGDQLELAEIPIPTSSQASDYIQDLRRFVEGQENVSDAIFQALNKLEEFTTCLLYTSRCV